MKKIIFAVFLLALSFSLTGLASAQEAKGTFKFPLITDISGRVKGWGIPQKIAFDIAIADVNAAGGINKFKVQGDVYDSSYDPKEAIQITRKLIDKGTMFILGPFGSNECAVAFPLAVEQGVPIITTTASELGLTEKNRPTSFRLCSPVSIVTFKPAMQAFLKKNPNIKSVAIIVEVSVPQTIASADEVYTPLLKEAGKSIAGRVEVSKGTQDFSAHVTKIKGMKADGIVACLMIDEAVLFAKELKRQGVNLPVIVSTHAATPAFALAAKDAAEGWFAPGWAWYMHTDDPRIVKFLEQYRPKVKEAISGHPGDPSFVEALTYDAVMITAGILSKAKASPEMPVKKLRQIITDGWAKMKDYKGLMGVYTMPPDGNAIIPAEAVTCQDGVWKPLGISKVK
ncbi:MAG: ABC transporter substrate-binding protein [Pseudomonadota bacterium]